GRETAASAACLPVSSRKFGSPNAARRELRSLSLGGHSLSWARRSLFRPRVRLALPAHSLSALFVLANRFSLENSAVAGGAVGLGVRTRLAANSRNSAMGGLFFV